MDKKNQKARGVRKRAPAGETLRDSEARRKAIVDHAVDGIVTIDAGGEIESFNRAAERMFGYHAGEVIGRNVNILIPEPHHGEHDGYIRRYLETGQATVIGTGREVVGRRKDGSVFPLDLALSEIRIGDRRLFTGLLRDITDRKAAEERIRENARRTRAIFEQAPLGIAVINSFTGQFIEINDKYCEIVGFSEEEMLRQTFQNITHPEDLQADLNNMKLLLEGKIESFEMDKRYVRKDNLTAWVHLTVVPLWWGVEQPRLHIAMVEDITERKQVEEALRESERQQALILRSIPMVIYRAHMTPPFGNTWISANVAKLSGFEPQAFLDAAGFWESRIHPDDSKRVLNEFDSIARKGSVAVEYRWQCADGVDRWFLDQAVVLPDEQGQPAEFIGTWLDITERKQVEEALRTSGQHLRALLEDRDRIALGLHDNVIQTIYAVGLNLEEYRNLTEENPRQARWELERAITDLNAVIRDLRSYITGGEPQVSAGPGLREAIGRLAATMVGAHQVRFSLKLAPQAADRLTAGQAGHVLPIVREAMSNTLRHAQAREGVVSLQLRDGGVRLLVEDDGVGFTAGPAAGMGHGLRNIKERAHQLGATLEIITTPGRGTHIVLDIPT